MSGKNLVKYPKELMEEAIKLARRQLRKEVEEEVLADKKFTKIFKKVRKRILWWTLASVITCLLVVSGVVFYFYQDLPNPEGLRNFIPKQTSFVKGTNKELLDGFYEENRRLVTYHEIPITLGQAILAAEDKNCLSQPSYYFGFDVVAIIRAVAEMVYTGEIHSGASTVYQQVVRMVWGKEDYRFDRRNFTFARKVREALMAYKLFRHYSKEEIFVLYCNLSYFGDGRYGVDRAAWHYFRKPLKNLDVGECALLAGLIQNPARYSPFEKPEAAHGRRNVVLQLMRDAKFITYEKLKEEENKKLSAQLVDAKPTFLGSLNYPIEMLKRELKQSGYSYDDIWGHGALDIQVTIDPELQAIAEKALLYGIKLYEDRRLKFDSKDKPVDKTPLQGAVVVIENKTCAIRALVGGRNFYDKSSNGRYNRAVQGLRQPGSSFKPLVYATALENGWTPFSQLKDTPIDLVDRVDVGGRVLKRWRPKNYPSKILPPFLGEIVLWKALEISRNLPAIHLAMDLSERYPNGEIKKKGIKKVIELAHQMGITTFLDPSWPIAIGGYGVSLIDLASVYSVFPNDGIKIRPYLIETIKDRAGRLRYKHKISGERVIKPETARQMTAMLRNVVLRGTAVSVNNPDPKNSNFLGIEKNGEIIIIPIAGKTGTTNDFIDALFCGYNPSYTIVAKVGFDDYEKKLGPPPPAAELVGGKRALPIVSYVFREIYKHRPIEPFPEDIENLVKEFHK